MNDLFWDPSYRKNGIRSWKFDPKTKIPNIDLIQCDEIIILIKDCDKIISYIEDHATLIEEQKDTYKNYMNSSTCVYEIYPSHNITLSITKIISASDCNLCVHYNNDSMQIELSSFDEVKYLIDKVKQITSNKRKRV